MLALDVDKLARERFRFLAHFERRKAARFLHDFVFDRQSVAIPARHIRRAKAGHRFRFHDEILEDFVERGAHVDVAIGERRPVMQDEELRLGARRLNPLVEPRLLPRLEHLRLARGEVCLHRKIRFRQVERLLVILAHARSGEANIHPRKSNARAAPASDRKTGEESVCLTTPGRTVAQIFHFEPEEK